MKRVNRERLNRKGTALIITLAFLTIITILILGFVVSMRTERLAAGSMADNEQAKQVAQSALVHAISLLRDNIPDPTDPTTVTPINGARNWFSNPGRLTVIDNAGTHTIPLYSGEASSADPAQAANLNAASPTTGKHPITGSDDPMWVSWINVLQDASAPADANNKVVGRYAFWMDDESTKINFNVARGKPAGILPGNNGLPADWQAGGREMISILEPTFSVGQSTVVTRSLADPAGINLNNLGVDVGRLQDDVASKGFFSNPEAIKEYVTGNADDFYEQHKFDLTPFSRSPEFNVFGKSRIFIASTPLDLATAPFYQNYFSDQQPVQFYGKYAAIGNNTSVSNKTAAREMRDPAIQVLANYFNRNDWPGFNSKKFRWNTSLEACDQVAVNMGCMGYWGGTQQDTNSENANLFCNAFQRWGGITGAYPTAALPNGSFWRGPLSGKPLLPAVPFPQMTEFAFNVTPIATGSQYYITFNFSPEYYLPPGGRYDGLPGTTPRNYGNAGSNNFVFQQAITYCSVTVSSPTLTVTNTFTHNTGGTVANGIETDMSSLIPLNDYTFKVMKTLYIRNSNGAAPLVANQSTVSQAKFTPPIRVTAKVRTVLYTKNGNYFIQAAPVTVHSGEGGDAQMQASTDDQSVLEYDVAINSPVDLLIPYTQSYEINDANLSGKKAAWILNKSFLDAVSNTYRGQSLGDVNTYAGSFGDSEASKWAMWPWDSASYNAGFSGMFSLVPVGMTNSTPFDTLKFHDYTIGPSEIPDWAVLDLVAPRFGYPVSWRNSTAGKINLNSKIFPSDNGFFAPPERVEPLRALFKNMPNDAAVVDKIIEYQNSGNSFDYVGRAFGIQGVADSSLGATPYQKEAIVRNLASVMTTQSNTFGVWGVAQTVRKGPRSTSYGDFEQGDFVTGEKRFYAVVERYVWPGKDGVAGNGTTDSTGVYSAVASSNTSNPGAPPPGPWQSGATANPLWAALDGPQPIDPDLPAIMGRVPYTNTSLAMADNPLAAVMKYRIIYFTYLN